MKFSIVLFVIIFTLTALPVLAKAESSCACAIKYSDDARQVKYERKKFKAVFSGQVLDIKEKGENDLEVIFAVKESWKNAKVLRISVFTVKSTPASCGYDFVKGETYLVFAWKADEGELRATICSRTKLLTEAALDVRVLGKGKVPKG
jgi:hypothetical protein